MAAPSENLFIGDLPSDFGDEQLKSVFGAYGTIKSHKILAPSSSGSGNALISFATLEEARWIVENLNGNIPQGLSSPIQARYKDDKKGKGKDAGKGYGGYGGFDAGFKGGWPGDGGYGKAPAKGAEVPSESLFIGDLPPDCDDAKLLAVFGPYGTIKSHKITPPGVNGKLAAVITFADMNEAKWIVENLNGNIPQGFIEPIQARYKRQKEDKGKGCGGWEGGGWDAGKGGGWDSAKGGGWDQGKGGGWDMGKGCGGGKGDQVSESLFISDLPLGFDDAQLQSVFGPYGTIASHRILPPNGMHSKVAAIVTFVNRDEAKWIVENLNGNIPQGLAEPIKTRYKEQRPAFEKGYDKGYGDKGGCGGCYGKAVDAGYGKGDGGYGKGDGGYGKAEGGYCKGDGVYGKADAGYGKGWQDAGPYVGGYCGGKDCGKGCGGGCGIRALVDGLFASGCMPGGGKGYSDGENTLFVGGLPHDTHDVDLYKIFSPFGAISAYGIRAMPGEQSLCKGFGFVNFQDVSCAQAAIDALNCTKLPDGKELRVSIKRLNGEGKGDGKDKGKGW